MTALLKRIEQLVRKKFGALVVLHEAAIKVLGYKPRPGQPAFIHPVGGLAVFWASLGLGASAGLSLDAQDRAGLGRDMLEGAPALV